MDTSALLYTASLLLLLAVAPVLVLWRHRMNASTLRLPPTVPQCYPIIGHLPFAAQAKDFMKDVDVLQRSVLANPDDQIPDVSLFYFGTVPCVLLNSRKAIQEAYIGHAKAFADRLQSHLLTLLYNEGPDILSAPYGDYWRRMRTALHKVLTPKSVVERMSLEPETRALLREMWRVQQATGEVPVKRLMQFIAFNVIFSTAFGRRFESIDDKDLQEWTSTVDELLYYAGQLTPQDLFPVLNKLPLPKRLRTSHFEKRAMELGAKSHALQGQEIRRLRQELAKCEEAGEDYEALAPSHIRDLIRMQPELKLTDLDVLGISSDMIGGGLETSSTAMQWLIGELVNHPEHQDRAFAELQQVCKEHDRLPNLNDRLPFCYALIKETLRRYPSVDVVGRRTTQQVTVCGYDIPAGINVLASLVSSYGSGVNDKFEPDRWLNDNQGVDGQLGDFLKDIFSFGGGRRICPGINLAYQELFMVLTRLLATFELLPPEGVTQIKLVPRVGITVCPEPYSIRIKLRDTAHGVNLAENAAM
ncbi:hypothetical protein RI367_006441 [Sorochytrium milnesiophthora]